MSWIRERAKAIAIGAGYRVERAPSSILENPIAEIGISLGMLVVPYAISSPGFSFVQVGAHDGRSNDPIRRLVTKLEWTGVLIEPQPELFAQLVESYSGHRQLKFENAAIAAADGFRTLYRIRPDVQGLPSWATQLASFDRRTLLHHEKWIPELKNHIEELSVPCLTLATVIERYGLGELDLLQIDAEGYDHEILKTIPFDRVMPRFVAFEHRHLNHVDYDAACRMLIAKGYRLAIGDGDTYAVRGDIAAQTLL
jgi:FkbM family methyltransferase